MAQMPYEFLARWDHTTGVLKGAHVKMFDNATGVEGEAQTVAVAGAAGFPLSDIMTDVQSGAVAAMDAEKVAHAATTSALNAALAKLKAAGIP